jgi:GDP-D-mannose dehydratase
MLLVALIVFSDGDADADALRRLSPTSSLIFFTTLFAITGSTETSFLEKSFEAAGLGSYDKYIIQNPKYFRPAEVNRLKGDFTKAKNILNWSPETTLDDLIVKMVSSDIERVKNEI